MPEKRQRKKKANNMKKIRKIMAITSAALLAAAVLGGCSGKSSGSIELYTGPALVSGVVPEQPTENVPAGGEEQPGEDPALQTEPPAPQEQQNPDVPQGSIPNEKPIILYYIDYATNTCKKVTSFGSVWDSNADLATFGAFVTNQDSFTFDSEITAHQNDWDSVSTQTAYKIGYELSFDVNGEHKVITLLSPADIDNSADLFGGDVAAGNVTGYMGVWMYDDYHQGGGWYSHVTAEEYNDSTLLTSIKLRPTPASGDVSNFKLKGFSYSNSLEFDSNGHYNGSYGFEVSFEKQ